MDQHNGVLEDCTSCPQGSHTNHPDADTMQICQLLCLGTFVFEHRHMYILPLSLKVARDQLICFYHLAVA